MIGFMAGKAPAVQLTHDIWVGPVPSTPAHLEHLEAAGIQTVVSVDALPTPDLKSLRVRRVHIPIGYDAVAQADLDALVVAWRDCPKPLYIHCHHGKHRAPAAAAVLLGRLGRVNADEGVAMLKRCGTSLSYPGLYRSARTVTPINIASFNALQVPLRAHARAGSMAESMANLDRVWKKVKAARDARWKAPAAHPDAAPGADCAAVTEHFRHMRTIPVTHGDRWKQALDAAIESSTRLEAALRSGDHDTATAIVAWIDSGCTHCHAVYRDGVASPPRRIGQPPWQVSPDSDSAGPTPTE